MVNPKVSPRTGKYIFSGPLTYTQVNLFYLTHYVLVKRRKGRPRKQTTFIRVKNRKFPKGKSRTVSDQRKKQEEEQGRRRTTTENSTREGKQDPNINTRHIKV